MDFCPILVELFSSYRFLSNRYPSVPRLMWNYVKMCQIVIEIILNSCPIVQFLSKFHQVVNVFSNFWHVSESFFSWCRIVSNCLHLLSKLSRIVCEFSNFCRNSIIFLSNCTIVIEILANCCWKVDLLSNCYRIVHKLMSKFIDLLSNLWVFVAYSSLIQIISTNHLIHFQFIFTTNNKKSNLSLFKFYACLIKFSWT